MHTSAAAHGTSGTTILAIIAICISALSLAVAFLNYWRGRPAVVVSLGMATNVHMGAEGIVRTYRVTALNRSATPITITDAGLVTTTPGSGPVSVTEITPTHVRDLTDPEASLKGPWRLQGYDSHTWAIDHETIRTWGVPQVAAYASRPEPEHWWRRRKMKDGKIRSDWRPPHQINS